MTDPRRHPLVIVVGSGGVGKTTLAAALGIHSATAGHDTLVMTFDPSLRLKDALGVDSADTEHEIEVGSTKSNIRVEICSNCHPFFTGKQKLIDTAGRIERFRKKYEKFQNQAKPT